MMTSTHTNQENNNEKPSSLNHLSTKPHSVNMLPPSNLPPCARKVSRLFFLSPPKNNKKRKSAHTVKLAQKRPLNKHTTVYFFKQNEAGSFISELEVVCCAFCRFIATSQYVPSAKAYYDEEKNYQFVGDASKKIPDWVSNHDNSLQENDIIIHVTSIEIETQRNILIKSLTPLIKCLHRSTVQTDSYLNFNLMQKAKNAWNRRISSQETAVNLRDELSKLLNKSNKFTAESLNILIKKLKARKGHIINNLKNQKYNKEIKKLDRAITNAIKLRDLEKKEKQIEITVEELEEFYKKTKNRNLNLYNLDDNIVLETSIFGKNISLKIKDLKNYSIIRGLGTTLTTRYIFKEADNHNNNMSKYGWIIDFDMTKFNILFKFKKMDFITRTLREPNKNTFTVTDRDIRNFPDIMDADFYYWPTKQTFISKSVLDILSTVFDISENFFSYHDNEIYKQLATNPIFIFHKFKTFLKYVLTDEDMYYQIAKLHLRADATYSDENRQKNILSEMVQDEVERIQEIRRVLIKMPEFSHFLTNHGSYAFKLIKEELIEEKNKYERKCRHKPFYKPLIDAIDLFKLEKKLDKLYVDAGAEKSIDPTTLDVNISFSMSI